MNCTHIEKKDGCHHEKNWILQILLQVANDHRAKHTRSEHRH